jgi:type IV pilus assembly protein PilC
LSQKIRSAVLYPKIVLGMAGAVFLLLVLFVIPRFAEVLELLGAGLPLPTRAALTLGSALRGYWYLWLLSGVAGYLAFSWLRTQPEWEERVQRLSFRLPFFGPLRFREALARAISTLGTLLEGGVPVVEALRIAAATSGYRRLEAALRQAGEGVLRGEGLRRPLEESGAMPREVTVMLGTGEEAGMLDRMCQRVARTLEREAEFLAQRLASSLEPVLIVVLGVIVGSVMLSVFIPVFHIYSSVLK